MDIPSLSQMIQHLDKQIPQLIRMLTALSYTFGFYLFVHGLHKLKQYGESRATASASGELKAALLLLIMATLMIYFPSTVHVTIGSLWHYTSPLAYHSDVDSLQNQQLMKAIVHIVQVIGVISAIRGLSLLSKAGQQGQPNITGKAITHLIAGVLAVNIYGTWITLENTLGFTVT